MIRSPPYCHFLPYQVNSLLTFLFVLHHLPFLSLLITHTLQSLHIHRYMRGCLGPYQGTSIYFLMLKSHSYSSIRSSSCAPAFSILLCTTLRSLFYHFLVLTTWLCDQFLRLLSQCVLSLPCPPNPKFPTLLPAPAQLSRTCSIASNCCLTPSDCPLIAPYLLPLNPNNMIYLQQHRPSSNFIYYFKEVSSFNC